MEDKDEMDGIKVPQHRVIICEGKMFFRLECEDGTLDLSFSTTEHEEFKNLRVHGDLIEGKEFSKMVKDKSFMDYDGWIDAIYIDEHETNLGISSESLTSGKHFLVTLDLFDIICEGCEEEGQRVLVDWVNK